MKWGLKKQDPVEAQEMLQDAKRGTVNRDQKGQEIVHAQQIGEEAKRERCKQQKTENNEIDNNHILYYNLQL